MKSLLVLVAVASSAYVGYSYNATDGESCLVCPMTGEAVFGSTEADSESDATCAFCAAKGEGSACCSKGDSAMLTSTSTDEGHGTCEKACCKDKETDAGQEDLVEADESEETVVAETTAAQ